MKKNNIKYLLLIFLFGLIPSNAKAATVYLESSRGTISVGDTVVVTAKIDAQGATINTVQGNIVLTSGKNDVTTQEFSLGNSILGLWPRTPSLSNDATAVSFTGGVPGGFNIEGATLFKIIYKATKAGNVVITPQDMTIFANDGKGTELPVIVRNITLDVKQAQTGVAATDDWSSVVAQDTTPPEPFIVVLGQDPSIYNGQKFAFFSAIDNQSGISYYDVSENNGPIVKSGSTYVIQNQNEKINLVVTAYDKAGNKRVVTYSSSENRPVSWPTVITGVLLILLIVWVYKKMRKGKKNASRTT